MLDTLTLESEKWVRAVATGPETGLEIFVPGRQDKSERTINPGIRSADLIVAPLFYAKDPIRTLGPPSNTRLNLPAGEGLNVAPA